VDFYAKRPYAAYGRSRKKAAATRSAIRKPVLRTGKKELIPDEGVFFDGQVFDAWALASNIIRSAQKSIILIDNYIDEKTIRLLSKREEGVQVFLLSNSRKESLLLDVQKAEEQFGGFHLLFFENSHDRFLIIDQNEIYHLGASLKDLGKRWFAFSRLGKSSVATILEKIDRVIEWP
jgi:hypothetical protein